MKRRKLFVVCLAVCTVLMLWIAAGCGGDEPAQEEASSFDGEIFFTGSSTLAPTISQIADSFASEYETWDQVDSDFSEEDIQINVSTGGSGVGAEAVIDGTANFGMLAREAREEEKEQIEDYQEYSLGIDALLVAVNKENELGQKRDDLTKEEIRTIFSDETSNWSDFDSDLSEEEIILLVRDVGGGAHGVFQSAIMGDVEVSPHAIEAPGMPDLVSRLVDNNQAIGYASYGVAEQHGDEITAFKVDGIEPTADNILEGTYPIARPLLFASSGDPSPEEEAFLDYIKSEKGSEIISEMGFLPAN